MPRQARLDAPDTLHHGMVRGSERTAIVRAAADRTDGLARLAAQAEQGAGTVSAGGPPPASRPPPGPDGDATAGARHAESPDRRCRDGQPPPPPRRAPFPEPVQVHRGGGGALPPRVGVLPPPESPPGHGGSSPPEAGSLSLDGPQRPPGDRAAPRASDGRNPRPVRPHPRLGPPGLRRRGRPPRARPEFQGGGLLRSYGGWVAVVALRRGREAYLGDERVLGGSAFVAQRRRAMADASRLAPRRLRLDPLVARGCRQVGICPDQLGKGSRRAAVSRARDGIASRWVEVLGHPRRPLAPVLGVRPQAVYQAVARGRQARTEWERLLGSYLVIFGKVP